MPRGASASVGGAATNASQPVPSGAASSPASTTTTRRTDGDCASAARATGSRLAWVTSTAASQLSST